MQQSLKPILDPFAKFISKYHPTIFITIIALLLIGAVTSLIFVISVSPAQEAALDQGSIISADFDKATVERVTQLRDANEAPEPVEFPPNTRTNPFVDN